MVAEISGAFLLLGLLCPVSMGVMMWFMAKGMGGHKGTQGSLDPEEHTLVELKTEHARLAEKISSLENQNATRSVETEERIEKPTPAEVR